MQKFARANAHSGLAGPIPALLAALAVSSCESPEPSEVPVAPATCVAGSRVDGTTYGAIATPIAWRDADMQCEGMRRPAGQGARIRFSGRIDNGGKEQQLAIILALPKLSEGRAGGEQPTRVTLIEEDAGRFFSTREQDVCWTDVHEQSPRIDADGRPVARQYLISGLLYCVAPIPELNGGGSVTLSEIEFSGLLDWTKP